MRLALCAPKLSFLSWKWILLCQNKTQSCTEKQWEKENLSDGKTSVYEWGGDTAFHITLKILVGRF